MPVFLAAVDQQWRGEDCSGALRPWLWADGLLLCALDTPPESNLCGSFRVQVDPVFFVLFSVDRAVPRECLTALPVTVLRVYECCCFVVLLPSEPINHCGCASVSAPSLIALATQSDRHNTRLQYQALNLTMESTNNKSCSGDKALKSTMTSKLQGRLKATNNPTRCSATLSRNALRK